MRKAPEGFEPVPSWAVTADMLRSWGFPVRSVEKSMGEVWEVHAGAKLHEAKHAAFCAGFVNVSPCLPEAERERRAAARLVAEAERLVHQEESMAWAFAQPGVRGREVAA